MAHQAPKLLAYWLRYLLDPLYYSDLRVLQIFVRSVDDGNV